jgi:hypothetical protein
MKVNTSVNKEASLYKTCLSANSDNAYPFYFLLSLQNFSVVEMVTTCHGIIFPLFSGGDRCVLNSSAAWTSSDYGHAFNVIVARIAVSFSE